MVVRRLTKFLEEEGNVKDSVFVTVDLQDLARKYRAKHRTEAIILLDGRNLTKVLSGAGLSSICGGEYKKVAELIEELIEKFRAISIELVFFDNGPVEDSRVESWICQRNQSVVDLESVFKDIELSPISSQAKYVHPALIFAVIGETTRAAGCKVFTCFKDQQRKMAKLIVENKYMGAITDDTDFIIFEGIPHLLSASDFNLKNMTTKECRRDAFAKALNINVHSLPMFATLMGNNCITYGHSLEYFKRKHYRKPPSTLVKRVAIIGNNIYKTSAGDKDQAARLLAEEIYEYQTKDTWDSLDSYDLDTFQELVFHYEDMGGIRVLPKCSVPLWTGQYLLERQCSTMNTRPMSLFVCTIETIPESDGTTWGEITAQCVEEFMEEKKNNQTYLLVTRQLFTQNNRLEDMQDPCAQVLSEMRQRMYSVLLYEKTDPHGESVLVQEICPTGPGCLSKKYVQTVKVEVDHPGLLKLWSSDESLNESRWKLAWWIVCTKESGISYEKFARFRNLPNTLQVIGLVLCHIYQVKKKIDRKELQAFMVMSASLPMLDFSALISPKYVPEYTTKRAVSIASLYQQAYLYVLVVLDVCGVRLKIKTMNSYSGNLFHYLLQEDDPTAIFDDLPERAIKIYHNLKDLLAA